MVERITIPKQTRREFVLYGVGVLGLAGGLGLVKEAMDISISDGATQLEDGEDKLYSYEGIVSEVLLQPSDIGLINSVRDTFEAFEPGEIRVGSVLPDTFVYESPVVKEMQVARAVADSMWERVLTEGKDGKKLQAIGDFIEMTQNIVERECFDYNNYYASVNVEKPDLKDPRTLFSSSVGLMFVDIGGLTNKVKNMPMQYPTDVLNYYTDNILELVDTPMRWDAKRVIFLVRYLLQALANPYLEKRGTGSLSNDIELALPGFSNMIIETGIWGA